MLKFDLLKHSAAKNFPTVVLTAHALSPESLEKSMKLGAVSFLPKEEISDIQTHLQDVIEGGGRPVWQKLFQRMGTYFNRRFGPDWKHQSKFLQDFDAFKESVEKD